MNLTAKQRLICDRVINVFETGTPKGKYGAISIYNDGPEGIRQVTYGRSQTTEYGNLPKLVDMYVAAKGLYSAKLAPYAKLVGHVALVDNEPFKDLLRRAGNEDPLMAAVQDKFFDEVYFIPARKWAEANGFTLALSMLVIYDSYIHSGSIRKDLRARFKESTPVNGGDEKAWIKAYVKVRNDWLVSIPRLKPTAYRTRDLLREIGRDNWDLAMIPLVANGTPVDDQGGAPAPKVPAITKSDPADPVPFLGEHHAEDLVVLLGGGSGAAVNAAAAATDSPLPAATDHEPVLVQLAQSAGVLPAMERLIAWRDNHAPGSKPRYWAVVHFGLHSSKPRLFVFDRVAQTVARHLCAHGKGSDLDYDGNATVFSNQDGSNCTSLGIYRCDATYQGEHGLSLYLDGLEPSNSNARMRHIVMHGAEYVSEQMVHAQGKIGRSLGCPAIPMDAVTTVIPQLKGGSFLIHWKP